MNKNQMLVKKFYEDVDRLDLRFPGAEIVKRTGLSKGSVSNVLNKRQVPTEKFMDLFYEHFMEDLTMKDDEKSSQKVSFPEKSLIENQTFNVFDKKSIDKILEAIISQANNFTAQTSILTTLANTVASQQETIKHLTNNLNPIEAGAVAGLSM